MRFVPTLVKVGVFLVLAALSGLMAYWLGLFDAVHVDAEDEAPRRAASAGVRERQAPELRGFAGDASAIIQDIHRRGR